MKKYCFRFALWYLILLTGALVQAQVAAPNNVNTTVNNLAAGLPASDAVALVDADKILTQALPRILAKDSARLMQINREIDDLKTRTGIDARQFKRVAVGMRFINDATGGRVESVALTNGTFNADVLTAAGRIAANSKFREETRGGKRITIFNLTQQNQFLRFLRVSVNELAVVALDRNLLALGTLESVRATVDAAQGRGRIAPDILSLAGRTPNALVSFGGNVPAWALQDLPIPSEEIRRNVRAIRQTYGALNMNARSFEVAAAARTDSNPAARDLTNSVEAIKQFAPFILTGLRGEQGRLARLAVDNLKIINVGSEMRLNLEMNDTDVAAIVPALLGANNNARR